MRCVWLAESNSDDHQTPSFHQSLLSGFSPVAAEPSPEVDGPTYPMSPVAAFAAVDSGPGTGAMLNSTPSNAARMRLAPARHKLRGNTIMSGSPYSMPRA